MQAVVYFLQQNVVIYPKSALLFLIGLIHLLWIFYLLFLRQRFQRNFFRAYLYFALAILVWILSNAWAESSLFISFGGVGLAVTYIVAFLSTIFSLAAFFYISVLIKSSKQKPCWYEWVFMGVVLFQGVLFSLFPQLAIERAHVFSDGSFELIQRNGIWILNLINVIIAIIWSFINVLLGLRRQDKTKIQEKQFLYVSLGISFMYGLVIIFHVLIPYLFNNYSYSWIPPAFSLLNVLIVGYGILVHRFLSLRYLFLTLLRFLLSIFLSFSIAYLIYVSLQFLFPEVSSLYIYILPIFTFALLYPNFFNFFKNFFLFRFSRAGNPYSFQNVIQGFMKNQYFYGSLSELQSTINILFRERLNISFAHLIVLDQSNQNTPSFEVRSYSKIHEHFLSFSDFLVTKEVAFNLEQQNQESLLLKELKNLGEVVFPLYKGRGTKVLIGFFVLGKKVGDKLYTKEELEVLQDLSQHISVVLLSILYNANLYQEVLARDIVNTMVDALDCIGGALFIFDESRGALIPSAYSQVGAFVERVIPMLSKPFQDHLFSLKDHDNYTIRAFREEKMFISDKYEAFMTPVLSKFISKSIQSAVGMKTIVSSPAITMGRAIGVFQVAFSENKISKKKRRLIEIFSEQGAIAISNAQKYQKLQAQYQKIQEVLAQQSDFIATSTHEFRTPLSASLFQAQSLLGSFEKLDLPKQKKKIESLLASLERLKEISEKVFAVNNYDANKVNLRRNKVDLDKFFEKIHSQFEEMMEGQDLNWILQKDLPSGATFTFDIKHIQKMLKELIVNAMNFSSKDDKIILKVYFKDDSLRIELIDQGVGIPKKEKENVFKKFKSNHPMQSMGIGLGLYIAKKIVELHQGEIWVEDTRRGGATFVVKLPQS